MYTLPHKKILIKKNNEVDLNVQKWRNLSDILLNEKQIIKWYANKNIYKHMHK